MRSLLLGLAAAGLLSGAARAQDATGDWIGKVKANGTELTIAVHIKSGAGGALEGYAESPDQTTMPLPMTDIAAKDGALSFKAPVAGATYAGKWDAAAGAWVGVLTQGGADMPLTLAHGKAAARPVVAGLDGQWTGVLEAPAGDLHLVLKVKTDANGTLALFSSPDQSPIEAVAALTHEGDKVSVQLKGIGGFDGALSADGKTIDGQWRQGGGSLPLTMKRGG